MCGRGADVWGHGGCVRGGAAWARKGLVGPCPSQFFFGRYTGSTGCTSVLQVFTTEPVFDLPVVPVLYRTGSTGTLPVVPA